MMSIICAQALLQLAAIAAKAKDKKITPPPPPPEPVLSNGCPVQRRCYDSTHSTVP